MNFPDTNSHRRTKRIRIIRISENNAPFLNDDFANREIERLAPAFEQFGDPDELQILFPKVNQPKQTNK